MSKCYNFQIRCLNRHFCRDHKLSFFDYFGHFLAMGFNIHVVHVHVQCIGITVNTVTVIN